MLHSIYSLCDLIFILRYKLLRFASLSYPMQRKKLHHFNSPGHAQAAASVAAQINRATEMSNNAASFFAISLLMALPSCSQGRLRPLLPGRRTDAYQSDLTPDGALETTKIHSVAGVLESHTSFLATRPFLSLRHPISCLLNSSQKL